MSTLRRLETDNALRLGDFVQAFEELHVVLRCCERLVEVVADPDGKVDGHAAPEEADPVIVEAIWTNALLSYGRCFAAAPADRDPVLTEDDLRTAQPDGDVTGWHGVLLQLRDHYTRPTGSPRELIDIGVALDSAGVPSGVAVTSTPQPTVDPVTVRQLGAISYSLAQLLDQRIAAHQETVFNEIKDASPADLEALDQLDVSVSDDVS